MDEISRDLPLDTTTGAAVDRHRTKGPEELVLAERGVSADDLIVSDASAPRNRMTGESIPEGATPAEPLPEVSTADARLVDEPMVDEPVADLPGAELPPAGVPVADTDGIDAAAAAAAVAAEQEVAEIEEDLLADEAGLPAVPELADAAAVARIVFVLILTQREGLTLFRLAQACNTTQKLVEQAIEILRGDLAGMGLPVELARTGDTIKLLSGADTFPYLTRLRGVKKIDKLSPAALETLAVIAYRQPVMRGEIEAIRGVKAGPMLRTLLQHKLVRVTGRADVPGRPLQYGTTEQFLERFGLASLQGLPSLKEFKNLG